MPERHTAGGPRRLRIVVLSHLYPSDDAPGRGSFVEEQCRALSEHCDLTVVTGRWGLRERSEVSSGNPRVFAVPLGVPVRLPAPARVGTAIPGYTQALLQEIARLDEPPDLIHAHFALPDGVAAVRAGTRSGLPVVVTLHGSDFNRQMARPIAGPLVTRSIGRADAVIAVSRQIAEGLATRLPAVADRIAFIPNGYDSAVIRHEPKTAEGDFLFIGAFKPVKNPLVLLAAYAGIAANTSRGLVMIGEGPLRAEMEQAITRLGLAGRVRLPGRVPHDELQPYFRDAHALVLPSASEGMPLVVIESLATGTPVVASAVGAIPDLVAPGVSGLLVAPGDVDGLAAAMLQAERAPWDHARIAREAPIIDWSENARRVTDLYAGVLGR